MRAITKSEGKGVIFLSVLDIHGIMWECIMTKVLSFCLVPSDLDSLLRLVSLCICFIQFRVWYVRPFIHHFRFYNSPNALLYRAVRFRWFSPANCGSSSAAFHVHSQLQLHIRVCCVVSGWCGLPEFQAQLFRLQERTLQQWEAERAASAGYEKTFNYFCSCATKES